MLISRISGCKGTTFYLFYKRLSRYILLFIDFSEPFFQFARPFSFVSERIPVAPSVPADGVDVQGSRNLVPEQSHVIIEAVGYGYRTVVAAVQDEGRGCIAVHMQFVEKSSSSSLAGCLPSRLSCVPRCVYSGSMLMTG